MKWRGGTGQRSLLRGEKRTISKEEEKSKKRRKTQGRLDPKEEKMLERGD